MSEYLLDYADISWRDPATPVSSRYGDIYWSGGLAEKQYVFIEGNDIARRLAALDGDSMFVVGEVGFGFGLNFLLTVLAWRKHAGQGKRLHYVSIEQHPVHPNQLAELYAALLIPSEHLAELEADIVNEYAQRLLMQYPLPTPGAHTVWLDRDIRLTLILDDAASALGNHRMSVDAWYLDGFSPAMNDVIWHVDVYRQLAVRTLPGGTLSTYTAAGHVRRGLTTAGFQVERRAGFGDKAEMITARHEARQRMRTQRQKPSRVVIVGAGMAGLFCAKALAYRQVPVTVLESADKPLQGASAVRQMAVYPQLAVKPTAWNLFSMSAFQHLCAMEPAMNATGFHMLITREAQRDRLARIADAFPNDFLEYGNATQLSHAIGLPVNLPGMMYHTAGWLDLEQMFGPLLELLPIHTGTHVQDINRGENGWVLTDPDDATIVEASHVIITSGAGSLGMLHTLPLTPVRGQSLRLKLPEQYQPQRLMSGPVTLFPPVRGLCTLSATYEHGSDDMAVRESDTMDLVNRLKELFPDLTCEVESETVGLRNVPRDRVPVVGPMPDWQALAARNRRPDAGAPFDQYLPGLYLCSGLASHGATHARLCAEYIASLICSEPLPLGEDWIDLLRPERFWP